MSTTALVAMDGETAWAQDLSWSPSGANSGGTGTWNTVNANWFNGSATVPWASGDTAVFGGTAGTVTVSGTVTVGGATFNTNGYTITGGTLALSGATPTITTNAGVSATIASAISGSAGLVKSGAGTLTLSGGKNYTGATIVDAGRLVLSNASGSGFVSATTVNSGATLTFTGTTNVSTAAPVTLNDGATLENINSSGYTQLIGALTSTGNTSINVDATGGIRGLYLDGGLKGSGTVTINTANAGNVVILRNNNSTFAGTLIINGIANTNSGLGSGLALGGGGNALINTNVVLNGTIELADQGIGSGFGTSTFNLGALSGDGIIVANRASNGNFGATIVLGNTNDSGLFSGSIIRGSGITNVVGVTKVGTGTQIFSGASTYQGVTNVNVGVLNIRNNTALGSTVRGTNVASGAALQIEGNIAVGAEALTLNGTGIADDGALRNMSGVNSYGGPITLGSAVRINSDAGMLTLGAITGAARNLTLGGAGGTTITGDIGITSGTLTKDGSGTAILSGTNTYTGATIIQGGTLQAGAAAGGRAFGTLSAVTLADAAGATLNLDSFDQTIGSLNGGGTTGGNVELGSATLTTGGNGTSTIFGSAIDGTGALVKVGAGTQVLTGTSTYSGGTTITAGTLQLGNGGTTGSITGNVTNAGTLAFARSNAMTFAGVISGAGTIRQIGSGVTTLTGNSSTFAGSTSIEAGTLSVNGSLCGDVNVASGGRLQGTGTVCDTTNEGTVAPGNSIGTLTVAGDYVGTGTLEIETILSGTGSPADRLLITGNASGTTTIQTINLGGTGALTGSGNTDGVSIVQVGGTSTANTFQLLGGYAAAGPYQYHLNVFAPGASAASEADPLLGTTTFWDYRLQSVLDASGDPVPVPQIAAYQSIPSGALRYGSSTLDSLHKRLGEIQHLTAHRTADSSQEPTGEFFLRNQGSRSDIAGDKGPDYDQDIWFVQFGGNVVGWDVGDRGASLRVGAAISLGGSQIDIDGSGASVDLNGTGLALTTTYQGPGGWYLDAVAQATRYTASVETVERGQTGSPKGLGLGTSLEGGYPVDLGSKLILEPQAQLAYQHVSFDSFTDIDGINVDLQGGESLRGRIGGRVQKTFAGTMANEQTLWSPYLEVNALHEFLDGEGIRASGVTFDSDNGGTSVQFGGGLNAQLSANAAIFANISYEKGISDGTADSWSGTLGLRFDF